MKILQVITSLRTGGAEKLIVDMVPLYLEQGHQVDVLLFDGAETPFKKQLRDKGVTIYQLGEGGSVYNPLYIFKLIPFLREYDIVHTHNTACQYYVALAKWLSGYQVKLVTTEHSTNNRRRSHWFFKYIDRFVYGQYDILVAISEKAGNFLSDYLWGKKVEVVLNGVDVFSFQQASPINRESIGVKGQKVLITMVARFAEAKDQKTLIRAMALLPSDFTLLLVGGGDLKKKKQCELLVDDLNLVGKVIFGGIRNDIPNILKASDIIIQSSHWEGFGLAAVEGMAAGKPVIASDVPGLAQVVDGFGILFPHGDAKALADIILHLHEDPVYYQQIADRCLHRAAEFDIHKTVDQYLQLYQSLLDDRYITK